MKKLEIEKTKPTFIITVLKVDIIKVGLVFLISKFFITKTPLANNWRRKKIPSCSYLALVTFRYPKFKEYDDMTLKCSSIKFEFEFTSLDKYKLSATT